MWRWQILRVVTFRAIQAEYPSLFSCDSSSIQDNLRRSVGWLVPRLTTIFKVGNKLLWCDVIDVIDDINIVDDIGHFDNIDNVDNLDNVDDLNNIKDTDNVDNLD